MVQQSEIARLKAEIAREKSKISKSKKLGRLRGELSELRKSQKKSVIITRRIGRTFASAAGKVGSAAIKQARLIKAEQEREKALARKRPIGLKRPKKRVSATGIDVGVMAPLDF